MLPSQYFRWTYFRISSTMMHLSQITVTNELEVTCHGQCMSCHDVLCNTCVMYNACLVMMFCVWNTCVMYNACLVMMYCEIHVMYNACLVMMYYLSVHVSCTMYVLSWCTVYEIHMSCTMHVLSWCTVYEIHMSCTMHVLSWCTVYEIHMHSIGLSPSVWGQPVAQQTNIKFTVFLLTNAPLQ